MMQTKRFPALCADKVRLRNLNKQNNREAC